jgi:hypothetical protein
VTPPAPVERAVIRGDGLRAVQEWASEVEAWPVGSHVWGHYAERTPGGDALCRTENVSACHQGFLDLVRGALAEIASGVMGEEVADFKDKLNYKRPGGAGFSPHQDLLAYPGVERVVSLLVAIDECTTSSGCLWLAEGVRRLLPTDDRGVVRAEVAAGLSWQPAELSPGDAVVIDGLAPHRSEANRSAAPRRVFVASYAPARAGYGRDRYYAARRAEMQRPAGDADRVRISALADFEGTEAGGAGAPAADGSTAEACTHPRRGAGPARPGGALLGDFTGSA